MSTDKKRLEELNAITERVIGCAFKVRRTLGSGFLEKVYENALAHELRTKSMSVVQQHHLEVRYEGVVVGDYVADLIVENCVLIELKAVREIDEAHAAQCINYLAATGLPICLLLNFGLRVDVKRFAGKSLSQSFPSLSGQCPSVPSVANSSSDDPPMTWAERAEFGDD